jgi:hypothetical protein
MAKSKSSNAKGSGLKTAAVATGVVAAIAGAVFLYGTDAGAKKRKQIKSWGLKAKAEVLEKLEKAKEINETVYNDVVKTVVAKYQKVKSIDAQELAELAADLQKNWSHIKKVVGGSAKKTKKTVKKVAKQTKAAATPKKAA